MHKARTLDTFATHARHCLLGSDYHRYVSTTMNTDLLQRRRCLLRAIKYYHSTIDTSCRTTR